MRPVALLPAEMGTMGILTYDPHSFDGVEVDPPCSLRIGMDKRQVFAMKSDSLYTKVKTGKHGSLKGGTIKL